MSDNVVISLNKSFPNCCFIFSNVSSDTSIILDIVLSFYWLVYSFLTNFNAPFTDFFPCSNPLHRVTPDAELKGDLLSYFDFIRFLLQYITSTKSGKYFPFSFGLQESKSSLYSLPFRLHPP